MLTITMIERVLLNGRFRSSKFFWRGAQRKNSHPKTSTADEDGFGLGRNCLSQGGSPEKFEAAGVRRQGAGRRATRKGTEEGIAAKGLRAISGP